MHTEHALLLEHQGAQENISNLLQPARLVVQENTSHWQSELKVVQVNT
jgi:hypothetical protein